MDLIPSTTELTDGGTAIWSGITTGSSNLLKKGFSDLFKSSIPFVSKNIRDTIDITPIGKQNNRDLYNEDQLNYFRHDKNAAEARGIPWNSVLKN